MAATSSRLGSHTPPQTSEDHTDHTKRARTQFVAAGRLVSVDPAAGTLTVTVHGGRDKALRGHILTVTLTSATVIRRNGNDAGLGDLLPGDHINVKGTKTAATYTATRVSAEPTEAPDPTPSTAAPTTTTPAPATTATPEPTPTTSTSPAGAA